MRSGDTIVIDGELDLRVPLDGECGLLVRVGEQPTSQTVTVKSTDEDVTVYPDGVQFFSSVTVEGITGTQTLTENGTFDVLDDKQVTVNVQPSLETLTATENGRYTPTAYGYSRVDVNVQPSLQAKTAVANGNVTADSGYYGLSEVDVQIPEFSGSYNVTPLTTPQTLATSGKVMTENVTVGAYTEKVLIDKTVTSNGTYSASSDNADGFEEVTVSIPEYSGSYNVTPSASAQTLSTNGKVMTGDVSISAAPPPTLISKTVTSNGVYEATDDSADGYDEVTVAIPTYSGSYSVTPTITAQTLATTGKVLEQDVTVEAVAPTELYSTWTDIVGKYLGRNMSNGWGLFTAGYGLNPSTGEVVESSNAVCEVYLPVDPSYTYIKSQYRVYNICCYDADKNFISHLGNLNNLTYGVELPTFPEGTKYIRFATHSATSNWYIAIIRTA